MSEETIVCYTDLHKIPFIIDKNNFEKISKFKWYEINKYIATTDLSGGYFYLHVFLFGIAPFGMIWDHINRDRADNRQSNLRLTTWSDSNHNRNIFRNNVSGVKGVYFIPKNNLWRADISIRGQRIYLGCFKTKEEAANARLLAEKRI